MKLAELVIENFRGIGSNPVRIKIDNIVVLMGRNNVGKSTILSAYEAFASQGSAMQKKDFHKESSDNPIIITGIFSGVNGEFASKWVHNDDELGYKDCVKAQYKWHTPDAKGEKYSYNPETAQFEKGGMGGIDSILASRIPTPIKISPLDDPLTLQSKIVEILTEAVKNNIEKDSGKIEGLLKQISTLAETVHKEIEEEINKSCDLVADELKRVFPDNDLIRIEPNTGKFEPEKLISSGGTIRVGNQTENSPLSNHGTGLQRAFLWAAIKMLADTGRHQINKKKTIEVGTPKVLLIEEPEAFLHPSAIKSACESLYTIAEQNNWQIITSTHSPTFVNLTKDHTTIIRLEKDVNEHTVRTFSTDSAGFSDDDRENLKMLNFCNPHFNEFFFSSNILLVEGETEHSVINALVQKGAIHLNEDFHVINCFGKANIVTVCKILNHFKVNYYVIHDSDSPNIKRKEQYVRNGMWSVNTSIIDECKAGIKNGLRIKSFVSVPNFEGQYLEKTSGSKHKPYEAWKYFNENDNENVRSFLDVLKCITGEISTCKSQYNDEYELYKKVIEYVTANGFTNDPHWKIDEKKEQDKAL
ncbi:ATP-dependent nuclease [Paenibacillus flagellatus]|uniref:Endonuclease n=1 Tax=Paenibacillus flagellatus TaxID=2211139 RepID=A0A2V5JXW2_9BACL|nr:AAA family ATPase [Paenibacillus flagellatus]PYI49943.1 endonuclease [Paenibacillus flagellatus]